MKIKVSRSDFKDFLNPIVRINENSNGSSCALHIEKDHIYTIAHTADLMCIYFARFFPLSIEDFTGSQIVYIADVRKILTALSSIDEDEMILSIDNKCISYASDTVKFKCYLLDPSVAATQKISAAKLAELTYNCEFIIDEASFARISKGCVFTENTGKIYFYCKDDKVFVDIDDKAAQYSVNNITFVASPEYIGSILEPTAPLTIEAFKIISSAKNSVKTNVNISKGVYMFYYKINNTEFKYFLRALKS